MAILLDITKIVPIPHEHGQTITIRRLSPRQLRDIAQASTDKHLAHFRRMGGAQFMAELNAINPGKKGADDTGDTGEPPKVVDPLDGHDADLLVAEGLMGWSYDVPFTPEHVERLDDVTAPWVAQTVYDYAKNRLSEAERGNA